MQTSELEQAGDLIMPAEWALHDSTWLSWPHNQETWAAFLGAAEAAMVAVVAALTPHEHVHINVLDADHGRHVGALLAKRASSTGFTLHQVPTNDAWIRDHGAIFVTRREDAEVLALDFEYNAWGGKYPPFDLDQQVASRMASIAGVDCVAQGMVLEGGSIDVNGAGCLLTTEQCLLNPNRNPSLDRVAISEVLKAAFGANQIVWLGDGIEGDDTDGHVDDVTRFVGESTIVTAVEPNKSDPNHAPLAANLRALQSLFVSERAAEVIELPMPEPQFSGRQRLPASYANFYIANDVVLMPVFGCAHDETAASILVSCLRGRQVIPIDARALIHGLGAIHCLTQQLPALPQRNRP
jgi:agmatine deiminase